MKSIRCVFKTVYLFILNEEKGGTCEAKPKLLGQYGSIKIKCEA